MKLPLLVLSALCACSLCFAATERFEKTLPLKADGSFELSNVNGGIDIIAWDKPEVRIEAEKSARSEDTLRKIQIKVNASQDAIEIKTDYPHLSGLFGESPQVRYKVWVPANVRLRKIDDVNGQITVVGVHGPVSLHSVNGHVAASGLQDDTHIELVNGSVEASFERIPEKAQIQVSTVNGSTRLSLPADTSARLDASSVNGGTSCELPLSEINKHRSHLSGKLGSGKASIKASSVNGSVSVKGN
jgi:DUF4097 and DUF4098 domain-containing protein YvlB